MSDDLVSNIDEPQLAPVEAPSTAVAVIDMKTLPTIMSAEGAGDILAKLVAELSGFEGDVSTEKGRKEIASKAYKAAVAKQDLIRLAGKLKESAQATIKGVNAEIKIVEDRMDALRDSIRAPLDEFEEREKARIADHSEAIAEIEGWGTIPVEWTSEQIAERIAELGAHPHLTRDWQEFKQRAQRAAGSALNALKVAQAEATARETQAAQAARIAAEEAEAQRQEDERQRIAREAQIAAQAAEDARRAAEEAAAEQAALEARRVEDERIEAERQHQAELDAAAEREREAAAALEQQQEAIRQAAQRAAELERQRVDRLKSQIAAIPEAPEYGKTETSGEIAHRGRYLVALHDEFDWQELREEAYTVIDAEISRTRNLLAAAQERETALLREDTIRREQEAEASRQAGIEQERLRQQAETDRLAEEARQREANLAHRRKINREVLAVLLPLIGEDVICRAVIEAIAKGAVPHTKITY